MANRLRPGRELCLGPTAVRRSQWRRQCARDTRQVNGVFIDGGADDNYYLSAGSPGIDGGYSWSYAIDAEGFVRRDDGTTPNLGSTEYASSIQNSSSFAATGTGNFPTNVTLPFSFPFYDGTYTFVSVSQQGYLQLGSDYLNNTGPIGQQFELSRRIAPLWDANLVYRLGDNIVADTSVAGQATIRWKATNPIDDSTRELSVVLFSDGRIRFDYGDGNTGLNPVVGISFGGTRAFQFLGGYSGSGNLSNANSVLYTQTAGYTDVGAYEFRGDSLDTIPPAIVSTQPIAVGAGGDTGGKINAIELQFSEDVNAIDASAAAVYELRKAGSSGFGSTDDVIYSLAPMYTPGSPVATLQINGLGGAGLPAGQYRLTVTSNPNTSIHDLAGLRLDGDADGGEGGNYVRTFSVIPAVADLSVSLIVDNPNPSEGMNVQYTVTVSHLSGPALVSGVQVSDLLPAGLSFVSATTSTGAYDIASGIWSVGSVTLGGSETLRITAKIPVGLAFQTLTNTAVANLR